MIEKLLFIPLIVKDLDEAFEFYTEKLGFEKVTDVKGPMHFLTVAPKLVKEPEILLQVPDPEMVGEEKAAELMNQIGKSPMWIFKVDDCRKTVEELREKGVKILNEPSDNPFATNAIIADLYGKAFLLQEPVK